MTTSPLRMPSGRAISLHEARSLGVSRRQWDKPSRTRLTRTVRSAEPLITLPEMAAGFALAMPGPFAFSHLTALVLHGLPLPEAYVEGPLCTCCARRAMGASSATGASVIGVWSGARS